MICQELQQFLEHLSACGDLQRVTVEVNPVLEIPEITDRMSKSPEGGKALFFERVRGSRFPVVTNVFGSYRRACAALNVRTFSDIDRHVTDLLQQLPGSSIHEKIAGFHHSPCFAGFLPEVVKEGPCQEIVELAPDLRDLPMLKNWHGDGQPDREGRFISLPLVFTCDPVTGTANCGMYLVEAISARTAGIRWQPGSGAGRHWQDYGSRNRRMPAAIVLGGDPALVFAASAPLPDSLDEIHFAGCLRGRSIPMVQCLTNPLLVPASAEIVIEGELAPFEVAAGSTFGNHTGYYVPPRNLPVLHVNRITRRQKALFPATIIGPPPMEDCYIAKVVERLMLPFTRIELPEIAEINMPVEGIFHGVALVAIDKQHPGQARTVMERLWSGSWLGASRLIAVVDADVDVRDVAGTFWTILNRVDWERDVVIGPIRDMAGGVAVPYGGRIGIDATRKLAGEGFAGSWPIEVVRDSGVLNLVTRRWREYGF